MKFKYLVTSIIISLCSTVLSGCNSTPKSENIDYVYNYDDISFSELYKVDKDIYKINKNSKDYSADKFSLECKKVQTDASKSQRSIFNTCLKAAKNQDPQIQYLIREFYRLGKGTSKNSYKSFYWANKSALSGVEIAQARVGQKYLDGSGVSKNINKGLYWLKKAAENKNLEAIYSMGKIYALGLYGQEVDNGLAFKWFLYGATLGLDSAAKQVSIRFGRGIGVKEDKREAISWAQLVDECSSVKNQNEPLVKEFSEGLSQQDIKMAKLNVSLLYKKFGCGKFVNFEVQ